MGRATQYQQRYCLIMKGRVFINADDIGLSRGVTDTILQVADAGAIDGVSIIATGEAFPYALAELHKRPQIVIALHANLTEGKALTRASLLTTPPLLHPNIFSCALFSLCHFHYVFFVFSHQFLESLHLYQSLHLFLLFLQQRLLNRIHFVVSVLIHLI